ncbi:MAG: hypothetical protein QNJ32_14940 [Xenococcaceae cyanobacterium MO_167.B27]|nr:hypothetical protein [Xenococcaceae cyanobacterium MO_167.B27]
MSSKSLVTKILKQPNFYFYKFKQKVSNELEDIYRYYLQKPLWNQVINQKEIRVAGLKRTGNHAITFWVEAQEKRVGKYCSLNNVRVNENPYRHKYQNLSYYFPEHQWSINNYKKQAQGNLIPRDCLVYSYEDYSLSQIFSDKFEQKHDLYLGKSLTRYDVIILRDPFNLFASRLKSNFLEIKDSKLNLTTLWLQYAKEFVGETNYLKHNKICINYNLWVKNIDYRREIANQLNIKFTDAGIKKVSSLGGGSSFDQTSLDGEADKMNVEHRWMYYADDPYYNKLINNEEILQYSDRIFGKIPGTENLLKN